MYFYSLQNKDNMVDHSEGQPYSSKDLSHQKPDLLLHEDFTIPVKMNFKNLSIIVTGVYLQSLTKSQTCRDTYSKKPATFGGLLKEFESESEFLMLGDMQCSPSIPLTDRRYTYHLTMPNTSYIHNTLNQ